MSAILYLAAIFLAIIVLMGAGMRIFYAILAIAIGGLMWLDPPQPQVIGAMMWESANSFVLTALPLFVLMAEILMRGGTAQRAFDSISRLLRVVPGGAAYANVVGSAVFAAISGSSVANAAALGTVAGPQMVRLGYSRPLTFGSIAAGGTLGILMPPSGCMIIYGSLTGVSIGQLFIAGIIPALLVSALFAAVIFFWGLWRPQDAPPRGAAIGAGEAVRESLSLLPVLSLIGVVLGGLYAGIFSPTEAGGAGVFAALLLVALQGTLRWKDLWESALGTVLVTSMIMMIIAAASVLKYLMAYLQLPAELTRFVIDGGMTVGTVLLLVALLYFILGMFVESVTLIILTIPALYPVMMALGVDGVWFGIYLVLLIEISLLTPPVGLNLFVLQKVPAGQTFDEIAIGAAPFVLALVTGMLLIYFIPSLALWLPELARAK